MARYTKGWFKKDVEDTLMINPIIVHNNWETIIINLIDDAVLEPERLETKQSGQF
jgi:hypothetical protein